MPRTSLHVTLTMTIEENKIHEAKNWVRLHSVSCKCERK